MEGIIGRKIGMTQLFREGGEIVPVTVVEAGPCRIVRIKTEEHDGYRACVLGFGEKKKPNKPYTGTFGDVKPARVIREIRGCSEDLKPGDVISVSIFSPGSKVDVIGYSKGKGFAGVMKRYGFAGGPGGHGSTFHRRAGSTGSGVTQSKVWKGHKMPGRMGGRRMTVKSLEVFKVDAEKDLLYIKGQVPGPSNGYILVKKVTKT
jgi:large subunit ribosomal protein L3